MAAAAAGCGEAGGTAVGLLPGEDRRQASDHLTVALPTGFGGLRNGLLVRCADGVIAVGGSWGTLSEPALAMRSGVPAVCLHGWTMQDVTGQPVPLTTARSPQRAVEQLDALLAPTGHDGS